MNPQRKMVYMQKLFNPSQYRSNGLTSLTKENFNRVMIESISKAINSNEGPVKEKHVRKLLIGSFQAEGAAFFWQCLPVIKLKENQIVCWKFCHVLHKLIRDGHKNVLSSSYEKRQILLDCGNMWRHVEDGYGQLIYKYCTLLYNRINFLARNNKFPNDLKVNDQQLDEIGERDPSVFFDLSCEIFDNLDDILRLQELILVTLDLKKYNSMSHTGQCHLAPLVACIQDSSLFYDYSVKILFKLHSNLPTQTLEGHRDRFLCQHQALKNFYLNASNLQYFKTLIQIPHLTERPPNFLVATDLNDHISPQVVVIFNPERDSPDSQYPTSRTSRDGDPQLLVNITDEQSIPDDQQSQVSHSNTYASVPTDESIDTSADGTFMQQSATDTFWQERSNELEREIQDLRFELSQLQDNLKIERANKTEAVDSLTRELSEARRSIEELQRSHQMEVTKMKDDMSNLRASLKVSKSSVEKIQEDCRRAQHDNEISQGVMKKLVKDLSDLRSENSKLKNGTKVYDNPIEHDTSENRISAETLLANDKEISELKRRVDELSLELNQRDNQCKDWIREKEELVTTKEKLEQQLGTRLDDSLVAEMNETDKIIKEAALRIEELIEKSRKNETGIKLQVNEKISEVCMNLMKAVHNLIVQSRLLQREIASGGDPKASADFYMRNSSWTEGLVSAANVVAVAARSLVNCADKVMSGESTKFNELEAAAHEVAAATTQLVVASRVKANKDSDRLKTLASVAKQVNQCTGNVVDTARVCSQLIEQEVDKVDWISSLSLHQTKKMEMETQVRLLELEDELSKERVKLGLLRRQHYEQEDKANHLATAAAAKADT